MAGFSEDLSKEIDTLYRRYRDGIRRYVARRFGSAPPDPEDVVQAVFEKYAMALVSRSVLNPRAFLFRSAHNHVIDERRRQSTQANCVWDAQAVSDSSDDLDAERVLGAKQEWAAIENAIADLDERSREFLLLSRVHGLSSAEIARRKGCSPTLVKSVIGRALVACHRALGENE
jgi:RNA polymerase sigma-70 factor (ECF subfamily)